jgi:hypothetical protein
MLELHVPEVGSDAQRRLEVAEAGGEDQLDAAGGHLAHHTLGVGAFGYGLDMPRADLVAERAFERAPRLVVLEGPAGLADGADIDETDVERLVGRS